ncbi:MAG TPA: HAD family hydrolase [Verrucomicrobiae bacterium]|nr:HAD family hydrolase [Verrucomicrobiae bacterium]
MKSAAAATPHDTTPEAALAAVRAFRGPLMLDLDETLYLRNSTEDFIDSAQPRAAAAALMRVLEALRPWRWTGGEATRDAWRVRAIKLLLPWTGTRWRRRVPALVALHGNAALLEALRANATRPVIVTQGFRSIVTPLVAAFHLGESAIVATRLAHLDDRRNGKLALALAALGAGTVRDALFITDSTDDLPLLDACARPLRTLWPQARCHPALADVYLPGRYLTRIKRPGERYIVRGILQEDFAFWVLASTALAALPVLHVLGLLLLLASFWTIYECGYVDNDRIAANFEADPRLSAEYHAGPVPTPPYEPWVWALIGGALALLLLRAPGLPTLADGATWIGVLLATHGWFRLYNRVDKLSRVWLYAGLQFARSAAFMVLVPVAAIGGVAIGAHVLAKWLPYYVYRFGGAAWPQAPLALTRLLFFAVLALLLALTLGPGVLLNITTAALLAWNLWRGRTDLRAAVLRARRLDGVALKSTSAAAAAPPRQAVRL